MPLFHWTTEQGTKLLPVMLRVTPAVPAVALDGESEVTVGAGSELGPVVEKLKVFEFTADGRSDSKGTQVPVFSGLSFIAE